MIMNIDFEWHKQLIIEGAFNILIYLVYLGYNIDQGYLFFVFLLYYFIIWNLKILIT